MLLWFRPRLLGGDLICTSQFNVNSQTIQKILGIKHPKTQKDKKKTKTDGSCGKQSPNGKRNEGAE
jgi:hypothetical protein